MEIKLIKKCGIYKEGDVVNMERERAIQYIVAGNAERFEALVEPEPEEKPKSRSKKAKDSGPEAESEE